MAAGSSAYRRVEIETASPEKLIVMLYSGAIARIEEAKQTVARKDIAETHRHLIRAQEILAELRGSLDFGAGPIAHNLDRVYEYLSGRLVQANLKKEVEPLEECLTHLRGLRDAWVEISSRPRGDADSVPATHNAHGNASLNIES